MLKKITLLLSLFLYNNILMPSFTESNKSEIQKETDIEAVGNHIYELLKERSATRNQLLQLYKKLPNQSIPTKETFSLGYVIGSTILTGLLAGPAFTINYLNKYITPEKYQNTIDKISLGTAGLIGAIGGFKVAKQGIKSMYDWFMYESIRKKINELEDKLNRTTGSISGIRRKDLYGVLLIDTYEKLYKAFIEFKNDNAIITKDEIKTFISAHPDMFFSTNTTHYNENVTSILNACINVRNKLILSVAKPDSENHGTWSTGNLSHDIILGLGMILLSPWALLTYAADDKNTTISSPYQTYRHLNEWEYKKYTEIDLIDVIIQQLKIILFETTNEPLPTNQQNPVIQHYQVAS